MILRAVDLENIRSHKSSHIEFKNGITVIMGDVGSGKTTILEAIKFALFGGSSDQYRNLLRMNESQGSVSILLESEEGFIKITRKLKKTSNGYSGSNVFLSINGKEREMNDREMKKFISGMFKVFQYRKRDPLFFKTVIYASQEEMKSIFSMNTEDRREMILDLFQITSYNRIIENCEILKDYTKTRIEISTGIIGENGSRILEIRSDIDNLKNRIDETAEKISNLRNELKSVNEKIKNLELSIQEMEMAKYKKETIENSIRVEKEKYETIYEELKKRKNKLKEIENKKEILKNLIHYENAYLDKEREFNEMQNTQYEYNRLIRSKDVFENELKNLIFKKNEYVTYKKEINDFIHEIGELKLKFQNVNEKDLEYSKNVLFSLKSEMRNEQKLLSEIKTEINDLRNLEKLKVCPKCKRPLDKDHTEMLINDDLKKIEEKEKAIDEFSKKIEETNLEIKDLEDKLNKNKNIESQIEKLNIKKSYLEKMLGSEDELLRDIEELHGKIEDIKEKILALHFEEEKFNNTSKEIKNLKKFHEDYIKIDNEIRVENEINKEIKDYETKLLEILKKMEEYQKSFKELNFEEEDYKKLKNEFDEKRSQLKGVSVNIEYLSGEVKEKIEELNYKKSELEKLIYEEKKISNYSKFRKWIDEMFIPEINGIISKRINALRIEFEKEFGEWFKIMLPGTEIEVGIDHNFSPVIRYGDYEMDFGALSGGESNALAFSYRLALNSMVKKFKLMETNFILLDEPTDGFSEKQIMQMGDVFSNLKVDQVLIVTHENALENFADNKVRIYKEDGISKF